MQKQKGHVPHCIVSDS